MADLVSLAAVFSIVTQRSSRCVTILKTAARETMADSDPQIRGAGRGGGRGGGLLAVSKRKKNVRSSPQFGLKIRGEDPGPPGPSPGSATAVEPLTPGYPWGTDKWPLNRGSSSILRPGIKEFSCWKWMIDYNFGIDDAAESKFGIHKQPIVLNSLKYKCCISRSRDMSRDHFVKNGKLLTNWWPV